MRRCSKILGPTLLAIGLSAGCDAPSSTASTTDAAAADAARDTAPDAAPLDAAPLDAAPLDAAPLDAAPLDALATRDAALAVDAVRPTDGSPPDSQTPDSQPPVVGPVELTCTATSIAGVATFDLHADQLSYRFAPDDRAPVAELRWAHPGESGPLIATLAAQPLTDADLAPAVGGVDGLGRLLQAGGVAFATADGTQTPVTCPRPDDARLEPWVGWRYDADFDGDGVSERYAWDADYHDPWVPSVDGARVVAWTPDPAQNRANLVAALRSGERRIHVQAPPDRETPWRVDNQIPIIKAYGIDAPDGLELIFDEGLVFEAADAPYFHDDTAKLISVDEMVGLRMGTLDSDGDGVVEPATLRMRRDLYDPASPDHDPAYRPSESRHVLRIFRSRDVLVQDLRFADSGGDGVYLGDAWVNHPEEPQVHVLVQRLTLRRVECADNYRQGMTVTGVWGLRVESSVFRDTRGTPPGWGIDFEPNNAFGAIRDVVIRDSRFIDNARAGIGFAMGHFASAEPIEVAVLDSEISGAAGGSDGVKIHNLDDGRVADIYFRGLRVADIDFYGLFFSGKNGATARVTLEDCVLRRTARRATWPRRNDAGAIVELPTAPVFFTKAYVDRYVGGVRVVDCTIYDDADRPAVYVLPRDDGLKAVRDVTGRLFVHGPQGAAIDLDGRGEEPNVGVDLEVIPLGE